MDPRARFWTAASFCLLAAIPFVALLVGSFTTPADLARVQQVRGLLRLDHDLLWRQRGGLDASLSGTRVLTDERGFRVAAPAPSAGQPNPRGPVLVAMGASPTFGFGVEIEEAWPAVTDRLLADRFPGLVIHNAAQIGFSSWQGVRLEGEVLDHFKPDVLLLSFGENDVDRARMFFSGVGEDRCATPPSGFDAAAANALRGFPVTAWMVRAVEGFQSRVTSSSAERRTYESMHVRTVLEDYRDNLRTLVARARERGMKVVLVLLPIRGFDPLPPQPELVRQILAKASQALSQGQAREALELADEALRLDLLDSQSHYLRGSALQGLGRDEDARDAFREAMRAVQFDAFRDGARYNAVMREVATETGTPLADPSESLGRDSNDVSLYIRNDPIHPNRSGHQRIAQSVAPVVAHVLLGGTGAPASSPSRLQPAVSAPATGPGEGPPARAKSGPD